jgi:hypothetical protein
MPYTITHSDGERSIVVNDQTLDTSTSLKFVGKNYTGYAKDIAENFLHLLENFADASPPANPTLGQLWYDTDTNSTIEKPQLKVFDGTNFVSATNVFKGVSKPVGARIGDIWIDISKQQLYIYSGLSGGQFSQTGASTSAEEATWLLIGPQFSAGSSTGPVADKIYDVSNKPHNIIKFVVGIIEDESVNPPLIRSEIAAILSFTSFTPKAAIPGFTSIRSGLNLANTTNNKVWGTVDKADSLVVGVDTVASTNFLRRDVSSTTNFKFNVANREGIAVGSGLTTGLSNTSTGAAVLSNSIDGSEIILRLADGNTVKDSLTVSKSLTSVRTPTDITGSLTTSGSIKVNSTTASSLLTAFDTLPTDAIGSIVTAGGIGVGKNLVVAGSVEIGDQMRSKGIQPKSSEVFDLGSNTDKWRDIHAKKVYATDFYGNLNGTFIGNVVGTSTALASSTSYQLVGEVESNSVQSTGDGNPVTLTTGITQAIFDNRGTPDPDSSLFDQILINRPQVGLKRISKQTFISNIPLIPIGGIILYSGAVPPAGYLICDGAQLLISDYQRLYNVIGRAYSTDSSLTTFNLPTVTSPFTGPGQGNYIIYTGVL